MIEIAIKLTQRQIDVICKGKWYASKLVLISNPWETPMETYEIDNPINKMEFLNSYYRELVESDIIQYS